VTVSSRVAVALVAVGVAAQFACAKTARPAAPAPSVAPKADLVVLLPDEDGTVGRAVVSNATGSTELTTVRAATHTAEGKAPTEAATLSEEEVLRRFGGVLEGLPPAPRNYTLHFRFESNQLTPESQTRVQEILSLVRENPGFEVAVVGHTDTSGASAKNYELGLSRARMVRDILVAARLDPALIDVVSHGEGNPAVPTADNVPEPRNRRVEITLR
jgi:outer membrane protein OmpA-like peptidoglycan-associated protein